MTDLAGGGTICQFAHVKTEAFSQLYLDSRSVEFAAAVCDHHLEYAGVHLVAYGPNGRERLFDDAALVIGRFDGLADAIVSVATGGCA